MNGLPAVAAALLIALFAPMSHAAQASSTPSTSSTSPAATSRPAILQPPKADQIPQLLKNLGHPSYKVRNEATERLKMVPRRQLTEPLARLFRTTKDYEVKLLIKEIAETVYLKEHAEGFLGVALDPRAVRPQDEPRLAGEVMGIKVTRVVQGTAASRAGILRGDIIIACDGKPLPTSPNAGNDASKGFREYIGAKNPDTRLRLDVLRGNRVLKIELQLGTRPEQYWVREKQEKLSEIEQSLRSWWHKNFESAQPDTRPPLKIK